MSQMAFFPEKPPETVPAQSVPAQSIPWQMAEELREQILALQAIMNQEVDLELRPIYEGLLRRYGACASLIVDKAFLDKLQEEIIVLRITLDLIFGDDDMIEVFNEKLQRFERLCDQLWSLTGRMIG